MSDNWLRYVPADPWFQPTAEAVAAAKALVATSLPSAEEIEARSFDTPHFIDAGANWEGVHCPSCGSDVEDWWQDTVSEHAEQGFRSLQVEVPCCKASLSLNDLQYGWPVAFGRFVLDVMNPNVASLGGGIKHLQSTLGCEVREVQQHL